PVAKIPYGSSRYLYTLEWQHGERVSQFSSGSCEETLLGSRSPFAAMGSGPGDDHRTRPRIGSLGDGSVAPLGGGRRGDPRLDRTPRGARSLPAPAPLLAAHARHPTPPGR